MGSNHAFNDRLRLAALKRKYRMMNLRNKGLSDTEIAAKCGVSRQRVHQILGRKRK